MLIIIIINILKTFIFIVIAIDESVSAHSANEMLVWFFPPRFLEWESFSDCACS